MSTFSPLASPWWVNGLVFIPIFLLWYFHQHRLQLVWKQLTVAALFGIAFGFVEASVVIYLRAALGFLPGYLGTLSDVIRSASVSNYQQMWAVTSLPNSLVTVEFFREIATMVMLVTIALLTAQKTKERFAIFVWAFAFWDLFYYLFLWLTVRWPYSLLTQDVLFLIPTPWVSQIWFPLLVDVLAMAAVALNLRTSKASTNVAD